MALPHPPKGKHLFGAVKVGEKGQIVIPKDAREIFHIQPGDSLIVLGDEKRGLAILPAAMARRFAEAVFGDLDAENAKEEPHD